MDWNNLTPIQLMALGVQYAYCECNPTTCKACWLHKIGVVDDDDYTVDKCVNWVVEHPEEALEHYGMEVTQVEDAERRQMELELNLSELQGRADAYRDALRIVAGSRT